MRYDELVQRIESAQHNATRCWNEREDIESYLWELELLQDVIRAIADDACEDATPQQFAQRTKGLIESLWTLHR